MLVKTITFKDVFTGETKTEDFYFNLTKAEAVEIALVDDLESVSKSEDPKAIIPVFKNIVQYAYGVRLPNGKFTKDPALTTDFLASDAYSELFLELLGEGELGVAEFVNAVVGVNLQELKNQTAGVNAPAEDIPTVAPSAREIAQAAREERLAQEVTLDVPAEEPVIDADDYAAFKAFQAQQAAERDGTNGL